LQSIGIEIDCRGVFVEQSALTNKTEDPKNNHTSNNSPQGRAIGTFFAHTTKRKRDSNARHKDKERHNEIPRRKALPLDVVEEPITLVEPLDIERFYQASHHRPHSQQKEEVGTSQYV
jgi:hypothetical protein